MSALCSLRRRGRAVCLLKPQCGFGKGLPPFLQAQILWVKGAREAIRPPLLQRVQAGSERCQQQWWSVRKWRGAVTAELPISIPWVGDAAPRLPSWSSVPGRARDSTQGQQQLPGMTQCCLWLSPPHGDAWHGLGAESQPRTCCDNICETQTQLQYLQK